MTDPAPRPDAAADVPSAEYDPAPDLRRVFAMHSASPPDGCDDGDRSPAINRVIASLARGYCSTNLDVRDVRCLVVAFADAEGIIDALNGQLATARADLARLRAPLAGDLAAIEAAVASATTLPWVVDEAPGLCGHDVDSYHVIAAPDAAADVWRVVLADGTVRPVPLRRSPLVGAPWVPDGDGLSGAADPRIAVAAYAGNRAWPVVEVLAPGVASRADLAHSAEMGAVDSARIDRALATIDALTRENERLTADLARLRAPADLAAIEARAVAARDCGDAGALGSASSFAADVLAHIAAERERHAAEVAAARAEALREFAHRFNAAAYFLRECPAATGERWSVCRACGCEGDDPHAPGCVVAAVEAWCGT